MRSTKSIALILLLVGASACGDNVTVSPLIASASAPIDSIASPDDASETIQPTTPKKLIRNAQLSITVGDVDNAVRRVDSLVTRLGAVIASSQRVNQEDRLTADLSIRVPANQLDSALATLRTFGRVYSESIAAEDITKAYADLEMRLAVKEQTLARLRTMLETKAVKLSDVLDIERELSRTLSEVEQMKGERRFYDRQVAMSRVHMIISNTEVGRGGAFVAPIRRAFLESKGTLGTSISAVVYSAIFVVPWLVIGVPLWRYFRKRRRTG